MFLLSLLTFWIISKVFKALSEGHWTSVSSTHEKKLDARFMLWETLILNWAGKGAKGLPRCRPKFLPGSGSSEAAPERSRCGRRSEGSTLSLHHLSFKWFLRWPFPNPSHHCYCIFAYSVFSQFLHGESVVSGL